MFPDQQLSTLSESSFWGPLKLEGLSYSRIHTKEWYVTAKESADTHLTTGWLKTSPSSWPSHHSKCNKGTVKREAPDHDEEVERNTVVWEKAQLLKGQPGLSEVQEVLWPTRKTQTECRFLTDYKACVCDRNMVKPTSVDCHMVEKKDFVSSLLECVRPSTKTKVK